MNEPQLPPYAKTMKHLIPFGIAFIACVLIFALATNRAPHNDVTSVESPAAAANNASLEGEGIVLLKFGATWCPPCRMIDKELKTLERAGLPVEIRKIDVDENPELASAYGVSSIPRLILVQNGREVGDKIGFQSADQLQRWIESSADTAAASEPPPVQTNPYTESE